MLFVKIFVYSIVLFAIALLFLFLKKEYRDEIRKILFPWMVSKCGLIEENRKHDEIYQKDKQKKLIRHQEMLRGRQKEIPRIVGIVKPVGKWTRMVIIGSGLMHHFTRLIHRKDEQKGFWGLFIEAQTLTRGKYKGRGR
ncbi:hypothetical protein GOY13_01180 [Wolbachia endosymbiont of Cruorifilaria tuberocauda]|uniref:hypothetical protein n=1 Tax=Wolbachia endosymbiont of Cruorifilaria tuberocauda TaxID=1812111 RepID=UPI00158A0507|nr:hypothetical protein [Wolbachia endosymbiont of Cruorifilaria tuberocauda]QKX01567.1 hypothetical protein GOY13_01180 [Wolbachia endosymbiont of Cruorifilaria tuberocauda]